MALLASPASTFFEETMNAVNYQLVLLLSQLRLCLRFLLSFLAAKLSSWTCEGQLVGTRKGVHTEVPALCWTGKTKGTSVVAFSLQDPLSNGGRGCWHNHWKTEFIPSLNNPWSPLHALRESEWVSLQMWWEAEMETITSKHFIWWGDCSEKILIFFFLRNKEKLMKGFEVIMTKVSTASLLSPPFFQNGEKKWSQRNVLNIVSLAGQAFS